MAKEVKVPSLKDFSSRMKKILLDRVKRKNAKGQYFVLTAGYFHTWKILAGLFVADGKLFVSNGKIRLIDVDIDAVRAELKAKKDAKKVKAPKAPKVKKEKAQVTEAPAVEAPVATPVEAPVSAPVEVPATVPEVTTEAPVSIAA